MAERVCIQSHGIKCRGLASSGCTVFGEDNKVDAVVLVLDNGESDVRCLYGSELTGGYTYYCFAADRTERSNIICPYSTHKAQQKYRE